MMLLLFVAASFSVSPQKSKYSSTADELAFDGNHLTAYHQNKVVKGSEEYKPHYDGLNLRFSSEENL